MPTTYRAQMITRPGGPEVMQTVELPVADPGPGELLHGVPALLPLDGEEDGWPILGQGLPIPHDLPRESSLVASTVGSVAAHRDQPPARLDDVLGPGTLPWPTRSPPLDSSSTIGTSECRVSRRTTSVIEPPFSARARLVKCNQLVA